MSFRNRSIQEPSRQMLDTHVGAPIVRMRRPFVDMAATLALLAGATMLSVPATATAQVSVGASVQIDTDAAPVVADSDPEEVSATTEPPEPVYEEQLDSPGPGYFWAGGYWGWSGADWAWYPGHWWVQPEGRVYVEPYYERVGGNVVFVRGYWGPRGAVMQRSYGGDRIVFAPPARPANYRRGEPVRIGHQAGAPPGSRPRTAYAHATGAVRAVPHETAPHRTATREAPQGHAEPAHAEPAGRSEPAAHVAVQGHAESPAGRSEPQPSHAPPPAVHEEPKPAPHAAPAPAAHAAAPAPAPKKKK
jgi:hypothetical protein